MTVEELIDRLLLFNPCTEIRFVDDSYDEGDKSDEDESDYDHDNVLGEDCMLGLARIENDKAYYSEIGEKYYLAISINDFRCIDC